MARAIPIAVVQEAPLPVSDTIDRFAADVQALLARFPQTRMVVHPELHLFGVDSPEELVDAAELLAGPRVKVLAALAGDLGVWLLPGSLCEVDADAPVRCSTRPWRSRRRAGWPPPTARSSRWRPYEIFGPATASWCSTCPRSAGSASAICYDAWFPEVRRHLAWRGAEVVVNPTQTTTSDRAQELVLARANAIVNQVFVVSVNAAAPPGVGRSLVVDPEGRVRVAADDPSPAVLTDVLDLDEVTRVRQFGTAGPQPDVGAVRTVPTAPRTTAVRGSHRPGAVGPRSGTN